MLLTSGSWRNTRRGFAGAAEIVRSRPRTRCRRLQSAQSKATVYTAYYSRCQQVSLRARRSSIETCTLVPIYTEVSGQQLHPQLPCQRHLLRTA